YCPVGRITVHPEEYAIGFRFGCLAHQDLVAADHPADSHTPNRADLSALTSSIERYRPAAKSPLALSTPAMIRTQSCGDKSSSAVESGARNASSTITRAISAASAPDSRAFAFSLASVSGFNSMTSGILSPPFVHFIRYARIPQGPHRSMPGFR